MKSELIKSMFEKAVEEKIPFDQVDLWPAIQNRLQMSQSKKLLMKRTRFSFLGNWKAAVSLLAIALICVLLLVTPTGKTLAQQIMHFFTRGKTNLMAGPTATPQKWIEQTPGVPSVVTMTTTEPGIIEPTIVSVCGNFQNPHCSVDEVRGLVGFEVYALKELPDKMHFIGAYEEEESVWLYYQMSEDMGSLIIQQELVNGNTDQMGWQVGSEAVIETVKIGDVSGEYVKGAYNGNFNPPIWDSSVDLQSLRWVDDGMAFFLSASGIDLNMKRDELALLAASLTSGDVGVNGNPVLQENLADIETVDFKTIYPLGLDEAEKTAGFHLLTPSSLPESLSFVGIRQDEKPGVFTIFYRNYEPNYPAGSDGIVIRQQKIEEGKPCELCDFVKGDYSPYATTNLVDRSAQVDEVALKNGTGQYLEGIGWVVKSDSEGWVWDSEPYRKRLRFEVNGLAIEVWSDSYELTREDLINIANNLQ